MKKLLAMCLVIPFLLGGCARSKDLTGFHVVGDAWRVTYQDEVDYSFEFKEADDRSVTLAMAKNHLKDGMPFALRSGSKIGSVRYRMTTYEETLIPFVWPIGIYELPLEMDAIEFVIFFSDDFEVFNGYMETSIAWYPSTSTGYYCLTVDFY